MNELAREVQESTVSRSQLVYTRLKDLIRSRVLVPGQRVREAEIADMTKVSRTPVREAMNRLISEGLLALSPARGFAVAELDKQQVIELYALREFLEGASARLAAQHASEPELAAMRDLLEESRRIDDADYERHAAVNREFHSRISDAAHNRYLHRALAQMSDSLLLVPGTTFEMKGRAQQVYTEHRAILDAMDARHADHAEVAAREHIRKASEVRLRLLFGRF